MFSSLQYIRNKAGLQMVGRIEGLYSVDRSEPVEGDGSSTVFYTEHAPIVDFNDDGSVSTSDVTVYVNGTSVAITSIDAAQGKITLTAAPANGANLSVTYAWSPSDDTDVTIARASANGLISSYLSKVYEMPVETVNTDFTGSAAEGILIEVEALLAASFLLDNRQTEDNNVISSSDLYDKAISILKAIIDRDITLVDSNGVELALKNSEGVYGYPTQSATDEGDIGQFFTIEDKQL